MCENDSSALPSPQQARWKKKLVLTEHARVRMRERKLRVEWVEATVRRPDWIEPEPNDPDVERRFRAIEAFGRRVLRVACLETETDIRVISVMFDRNARRKP